MEEDIKILERMLEREKECLHYDVSQNEIQAIENLIKGYRRLEAKVKRYKKYLDNKDKKFEEALEYEYQERETDYIPKSKIREIRDKAECMDYYVLNDVISDLNKLLEEEV